MKKNKIVGKIIDCALNILIVIFAILLIISMYTAFQIKILKNEYANFFGYSLFEVQTGSMHKAIEAGDWIIIKKTNTIEIGDIITYKHNKEYITHRVIESYKETYVTKGDANNAKDDPIDQSQIIGKVVKILPGFGIVRKTIFNPTVVIALIITLYLFNLTFKKEQTKFDKIIKANRDKIIKIIKNKIKKQPTKINATIIKQEPQKIEEIEKKYSNESEIFEQLNDKEEELSKTAMYRVVSVKNELKNSEPINEPVEVIDIDKNLEKTSMFRIISVNTSDITKKQEQVKEPPIEENKNTEIVDFKLIAEEIKPEKIETKKSIEEIINERIKAKKAKNIIEKAIQIKKIIYDETLNILLQNEKVYTQKSSMRTDFIEEYLILKYYNNIDNNVSEINEKINEFKNQLCEKYIRDEKQLNIINAYAKAMELIATIEDKIDSDIKPKLKKIMQLDNEICEEMEIAIKEIFKVANENIKQILDKLETNIFEVKYSKIGNQKNLYGALLNHNISFSRIYSNYIVDKTYKEGTVSEDKIAVLLNLLMCKIVKDTMKADYTTKYIIYIPSGLYGKDKKLDKILSAIDNEYTKSHIIILTTLTSMLKNKDDIKRLKKRGYTFAVVYNEEINLTTEDVGYIYMADYHFVDNAIDNSKIYEIIPRETINKIIKDNINSKIGDFRSE